MVKKVTKKTVEEETPVRKRRKVSQEEDTTPVKAKRRRAEVQEEDDTSAPSIEDILHSGIDDVLDDVEKTVGFTEASGMSTDRTSTGLLSLDLILGGGIVPGWYTHYGPEQSCKTTSAFTIMGSVMKKVPILAFFDYEGSLSDTQYLENIVRSMGIKEDFQRVFGVRDDKGRWAVKPLIRYRDPTIGEDFYDWLAELERQLPDKKLVSGRWWYIYENTKVNLKKLSAVMDHGMTKAMGKKGLYVPAEDGSLQAVVIVDSYPGMNPGSSDEKIEGDNSLAVAARMHSKHIPRVKGRLRSKRIAVIGVNQLRLAPMVRFGCLHADTQIHFVDGRVLPIKQVVDNQISGEVWSYNESKKTLEPRKITDWHYNGRVESKEDWITIQAKCRGSANGITRVTVTPDHEILTHAGWKRAKDIVVGDMVLSKYEEFDLTFSEKVHEEFVEVNLIIPGTAKKFRQKGKYDISVQGNKNYLAGSSANGFIVHNSPETEPGGQALKFFCFTKDTYLYTSEGLVKSCKYDPRMTVMGRNYESPSIPLTSMGIKETIRITTETGHSFVGAEGHKILVMEPSPVKAVYTLKWRSFKDLSESPLNQYVSIRLGDGNRENTLQAFTVENDSYPVDENLAKFLGFALNSFQYKDNKTGKFSYSFVIRKENTLEFETSVSKVFGEIAFNSTIEGRYVTYSIQNAKVVEFIQSMISSSGDLNDQILSLAGTNLCRDLLSVYTSNHGLCLEDDIVGIPIGEKTGQEIQLLFQSVGCLVSSLKTKTGSQYIVFKTDYVTKKTDKILSVDLGSGSTVDVNAAVSPHMRDLHVDLRLAARQIGPFDILTKDFRDIQRKVEDLSGKSRITFKDIHDQQFRENILTKFAENRGGINQRDFERTFELFAEIADYNVVFDRIRNLTSEGQQEVFDFNMPSHEIVTSGIVSHNSDVRLRFYPRALSAAPFHPKGDGQFEVEPSVENDNKDKYRYIHVSAKKNKLSAPHREGWLRLWVEDGNGEARGFDPVFDTVFYLKQTGQIHEGVGRKMTLNLDGFGQANRTISWGELKTLVLGTRAEKTEICKKIGYKPLDIRKFAFKQMESGSGNELYIKAQQTSLKAKEAKLAAGVVEDDDEDED